MAKSKYISEKLIFPHPHRDGEIWVLLTYNRKELLISSFLKLGKELSRRKMGVYEKGLDDVIYRGAEFISIGLDIAAIPQSLFPLHSPNEMDEQQYLLTVGWSGSVLGSGDQNHLYTYKEQFVLTWAKEKKTETFAFFIGRVISAKNGFDAHEPVEVERYFSEFDPYL